MKKELGGVVFLSLDSIEPSPYHVRSVGETQENRKLKDSIRSQGLIHPVLVRPHPERFGQYELICGLRRYRAFCELSREDPERFSLIPAQVRKLTDEEAILALLEENELREDFTPYERALFFYKVYTSGKFDSIRQMARSFRVGVTTLHRYLRIFDLPQPMVDAFRQGRIGLSQIEVILEAPESLRPRLFKAFLDHPVRKEEARRYLKKLLEEKEDLLDRLLPQLPDDPRVRVLTRKGDLLEIRISFQEVEELKALLESVLRSVGKV
jgi:ParB family chromosome partitioning protein